MKRILFALMIYSGVELARANPAERPLPPTFSQYVELLQKNRDYLGLRVFLKAFATRPKRSKAEWLIAREALQESPQVGLDLLYAWKFIAPFARTKTEREFQSGWDSAQKLMLQGNFLLAASTLERLTKDLRTRILKAKDKKTFVYRGQLSLYPYLLHSLARAKYGAGKFNESLQIYDWIPSSYPAYRQVLFETMWAAYRAGDVGRTLAAIASQKSAYFSPFLEPEAYLLQVYIYKKLCRESELKNVLQELDEFLRQLKNNSFDLRKWATWDSENHSLYKLIEPHHLVSGNGISAEARKAEMTRIVTRLKRAHTRDMDRLKRDIGKVISFSGMAALSNSTSQLRPIAKLPSRADIFASGFEIWPADKGEDWVDEIGTQRFLGESRCAVRI